jgi:hypothetical protein
MSSFTEYQLAKVRQAELIEEAAAYRQVACREPFKARMARSLTRLRSGLLALL